MTPSAGRLADDDFLQLLRLAPLVSIDLLVHDGAGRYLLGQRRHRPAQGYWFVPGGRIYKDETLDAAFRRICQQELGRELPRSQAQWHSLAQHCYVDNFAAVAGVSTHYIVLAHRIELAPSLIELPDAQHLAYRWLRPQEIVRDATVHEYCQAYFRGASVSD